MDIFNLLLKQMSVFVNSLYYTFEHILTLNEADFYTENYFNSIIVIYNRTDVFYYTNTYGSKFKVCKLWTFLLVLKYTFGIRMRTNTLQLQQKALIPWLECLRRHPHRTRRLQVVLQKSLHSLLTRRRIPLYLQRLHFTNWRNHTWLTLSITCLRTASR